MRKTVILLMMLLIMQEAYAATRVISTYRPVPYNRSGNPFVRPHAGYYGRYYNNRYWSRNYLRPYVYPYYSNSYGRISDGVYYPVYYNGNGNVYSKTSNYNCENADNTDTRFNKIYTMKRILESDSREYSNPDLIYRLKSSVADKIIPVANTGVQENNSKLSLVEKNIYGKSFENQGLSLRLNRLEKEFFNKTFPSMSTSERINNLLVNFNSQSISSNELTKLEKQVLKKSYNDDTYEARISRLEEKLFGTIQSGDLSKRFEKLQSATLVQTAQTPPVAPYGTCYGGYTPQTGWRNTLSRAGRFFNGYPTGVTPPLYPYGMSSFGLGGSGIQQGYTDNWGGYAYSNTSRTGGVGVHILD